MLFYVWPIQMFFLKVLPKRNPEVSRADHARAIPTPNLIKILRVLIRNPTRIGDIIDVDSGAPAVCFKSEDGVRYVIVALTQFIRRKSAGQLIIRLAHIIVLQPQIAAGTKQVKTGKVDIS